METRMKKTNAKKKTTITKKSGMGGRSGATIVKVANKPDCKPEKFHPWSLSIYVYWFIILFFISATFYILGRSHDVVYKTTNDTGISEEVLLQSQDFYDSGKTKLMAGNLDDAISDLTAAIKADPGSVAGYLLRGEAY